MRRKRKVRFHLKEGPSSEGYLCRSLFGNEYMIRMPAVKIAAERDPEDLEGRMLRIPRENVVFYEVL